MCLAPDGNILLHNSKIFPAARNISCLSSSFWPPLTLCQLMEWLQSGDRHISWLLSWLVPYGPLSCCRFHRSTSAVGRAISVIREPAKTHPGEALTSQSSTRATMRALVWLCYHGDHLLPKINPPQTASFQQESSKVRMDPNGHVLPCLLLDWACSGLNSVWTYVLLVTGSPRIPKPNNEPSPHGGSRSRRAFAHFMDHAALPPHPKCDWDESL